MKDPHAVHDPSLPVDLKGIGIKLANLIYVAPPTHLLVPPGWIEMMMRATQPRVSKGFRRHVRRQKAARR